MWLGTFGNGVSFVPANEINNIRSSEDLRFTNYNSDDGLTNNVVYSILEDSNGTIWFATEQGISSFHVKTKKFFIFTRN